MKTSSANIDESVQHKEKICGSVERITFHNESNGFCVLRVRAKDHWDLITVVGSTPHITSGEYIECNGYWHNDKKFGQQFCATKLKTIAPNTLEGIEKYLGSGMVPGIGPHFAKVLVKAFAKHVFEIIEKYPDKLLTLPGIGEKRIQKITSAWAEQKIVRKIMVFLQSHDIGTARAVRIYKTYGDQAIEKVQENPYRLALDIHGIGFKTADTLAQKLGIATDSLIRAQAGVRHVLQNFSTQGHCAVTQEDLIKHSSELLGIHAETIAKAITEELKEQNLIADTINNQPYLYLSSLYQSEQSVAHHLHRIAAAIASWQHTDLMHAIPAIEKKTGTELSPSQRQAVQKAIQSKLMVITGGPGVGKTTIVNTIIKTVRSQGIRILLAAPTGRAAKRLSESTGLEAKTIHRLLEFQPGIAQFKHNQNNPLCADLIVIDEVSMIDIVLMSHLLKAIPNHAALLLVGDVDQLPSVGPGTVLTDMIQSQVITTAKLTEIFRQVATSKIIINAHRINQGQPPITPKQKQNNNQVLSDFYFIPAQSVPEIQEKLLHVVTQRIPQRFHLHPIRDVQVLSPMNRGELGTRNLNTELQKLLNANSEPKINRYGWNYAPGDKVIQTINNYDKEVFNGDVGQIKRVDLEESSLYVDFDNRIIEYELNALDELSLAYATTIHKSQGSEYPAVVIPLATQHYTLLERNLLYTAVTRGKKLVVIIGQPQALAMAIRNVKSHQRLTKLAQRLKDVF